MPGKTDGKTCWYGYCRKEYKTKNFRIVQSNRKWCNRRGKAQGLETKGNKKVWCAVAKTPYGEMPAKAIGGDKAGDRCWYTYDGKEHRSNDFYWIVSKGHPDRTNSDSSRSGSSSED